MPIRGTKDGQTGYAHQINNEWRFIPDDPANAPGVGPRGLHEITPEFIRRPAAAAGIALDQAVTTLPTRIGAILEGFQDQSVMETPENIAEIREVESLMQPLRERHPIATAVGASVPEFLLPSSKAAQTAGGAAVGALEMPEHPLVGGALYGGLSAIFGVGGERLARAVQAKAGGALGVLAREGIPTSRFQRTGADIDKIAEAGLEAIPVISSWATRPARVQQSALNRGAAAVFGMTEPLTRRNLNNAKFSVQKLFQQVQNNLPDTPMDKELIESVSDHMNPEDLKLFQQTGQLDGEALMRTRSSVNEAMADFYMEGATRPQARALNVHLNELDNIINGAMPEHMADQWSRARQQWQFLTALRKGQAVSGTGDVNLRSMTTALDRIYPNFRFGDNLPPAARGFGELVQALDELPKTLQSSGTAERAAATAAMTGAGALDPSLLAVPALVASRQVGQPGADLGAQGIRALVRPQAGPISDYLDSVQPEESEEEQP